MRVVAKSLSPERKAKNNALDNNRVLIRGVVPDKLRRKQMQQIASIEKSPSEDEPVPEE